MKKRPLVWRAVMDDSGEKTTGSVEWGRPFGPRQPGRGRPHAARIITTTWAACTSAAAKIDGLHRLHAAQWRRPISAAPIHLEVRTGVRLCRKRCRSHCCSVLIRRLWFNKNSWSWSIFLHVQQEANSLAPAEWCKKCFSGKHINDLGGVTRASLP